MLDTKALKQQVIEIEATLQFLLGQIDRAMNLLPRKQEWTTPKETDAYNGLVQMRERTEELLCGGNAAGDPVTGAESLRELLNT
ncbi:MAG: hypothetical protein UY96_C0017G0018 [Parcubacteria group bacterium GW2011_GWB1_56_8]|nr:MAG: hypothetical protein UY96_C0017G0018 [Parcubacteria group bacterium GW2011_GWB1_56_8]